MADPDFVQDDFEAMDIENVEDDGAAPMDESQDGQGKGAGRGNGAGRRGRGRGRGKAAAKKSAAKPDSSKVCFVAQCERKVRSHSKFCQQHSKDVEAIRYQAKSRKDNEVMNAVELALGDPTKAKLCLEEFAQNNPEGRFRRKLIDWSAFMQTHGKRAEVRDRAKEELMDVTDFVSWKMGRGLSEQDAMDAWKHLLETDAEREGEGAETKVWVEKNKERFKDTVRYKDNQLQEGSRQMKDMPDTDRPGQLLTCCNKVEIAIAAPKALEKNEKVITSCIAMATSAKTALSEALELCHHWCPSSQLQLAYEKNCVVRLHMLDIWGANSVSEIPAQQQLPSAPVPAAASPPPHPPQPPQPAQSGAAAGGEGNGEQEASPNTPKPKTDDAKSESGSTPAKAAAKVTAHLKKALEGAGSTAQHITAVGSLRSKVHMEEILQGFMTLETVEELNTAVVILKDAAAMVKQLKDGATKAANSLKSHIIGRQRAQTRKRQQETKQEEQTEVQKKKKQAKEAAAEIKKQETVLPPVFGIDWGNAKAEDGTVLGKMITVTAGPGKGSIATLESPCCISNCAFFTDFTKNPKALLVDVQLMLTSFGGSYKKNANMKSTGKCQEMVAKNNGLDECQELWASVAALFKSPFTQATDEMEAYLKNVLKVSWLQGLDSQGNFVGSMPNGLGCLRFQCSGEVAWTMFELRQLIPAMKIILSKDDVGGLEGVNAFVKSLGLKEIAELQSHGCTAYYCRQAEGQVVYVPIGWVAAERSVKGVLVYGLRKTVMFSSAVSYENYGLLAGLYEASKKPVDKMKATLNLLQPPEPE
eukprot:s676_g31.t1